MYRREHGAVSVAGRDPYSSPMAVGLVRGAVSPVDGLGSTATGALPGPEAGAGGPLSAPGAFCAGAGGRSGMVVMLASRDGASAFCGFGGVPACVVGASELGADSLAGASF
jgi:hypothetical protein